MKSLYKDQLPETEHEFRKESAYAGRLSEEPQQWPQELTSDLFKQLPYLSDYDVNVNLDRMDEERGFAFGYADVHNKTERPEVEHDEAGLPHLRIPLVVEERQVKPFSVFMDGEKVLPLNEERIREHLFNPSTFDLSTTAPSDPSLVEPLMPPHRSGIGMGGDYKLASADERLLAELQGVSTKTKKASDANVAVSGPGEGVVDESFWLKKFKGTPFEGRARELEARQLKLDLARNRHDQAHPVPPIVAKPPMPEELAGADERVRLKKRELELLLQLHNLSPKEKLSFVKKAFKHISQEQWQAMYNSLEVQKLTQEYGSAAHPAVQNKVYEMATKLYGYHPKPEPPPPQKLQEHHAKLQEKQQKASEKQQDKAKKMLSEGQKLMGASSKPKTASLLLAIAPTIREKDAQRFIEKVSNDKTLQAGFRRSGIAEVLVEAFDKTKRASADDHLRAVAENIDPTVVTIHKLPGGDFLVKSANNEAFAPDQAAQGEQIPQEEMAGAIDPEQAQAMQPGQTTTAVADPVEDTEPAEPAAVVADQFGEYLTQDLMGNPVMGWVFPTTLAWDGNFSEQPVALFTNGSAFAVQDAIAGELIGKSSQLPVSTPRGEGAFYEVTRSGVKATAPVVVRSGMTGPDGSPMFACQDFMGNEFSVHLAPELAAPQRISDTEYAIPATWSFMPLSNQTQLVPDPVQMNKTGAVKIASQMVTLFWNGSFNLEGGCGLNKLASSFRYDLDPVSAEFMLGLLGVPGATIKEKLSQARKHGEVKLANLHEITTLAERYQAKSKVAQAIALNTPNLRRDLIKEAASMEDEATVDKLLALNFVNPENLGTFLEYMPELEQTSEKLAEMLLSGYLGMREIPEGAVERSMKNVEEVIRALKSVEHAEA